MNYLKVLSKARPSLMIGSMEFILGLILANLAHRICSSLAYLIGYGRNLEKYRTLDITNKLVSIVFSVITCFVGYTVFKSCSTADYIKDSRHLIVHFSCAAIAYFIYDIRSMFNVFNAHHPGTTFADFFQERKLMVIHHLAVVFVGFPAYILCRMGLGDCLFAFGFFMEASTPFVSIKHILSHIGQNNSFLYMVNGLCLMIVFFFCRIAILPYIISMMADRAGKEYFTYMSENMPIYCIFISFVIVAPQIYWFGLILRGAAKSLGLINAERPKQD